MSERDEVQASYAELLKRFQRIFVEAEKANKEPTPGIAMSLAHAEKYIVNVLRRLSDDGSRDSRPQA